MVFGISDNGICISLKGKHWVDSFFSSLSMKTFIADAADIGDVALKTEAAFSYSRKFSRPSAILYQNIRRRFGHAATDRQIAYLTQKEIDAAAEYNNMSRKLYKVSFSALS